jgi:hypothetical protein
VKTLSEINPWGMLIVFYGKDIENRTWHTDYRGPLLIHVSKKMHPMTRWILSDLQRDMGVRVTREDHYRLREQCGHIIGQVELIDCIRNSDSPWAEQGMYHWVLKNPIAFENPIPAKGKLGLWEYEGALES